VNWKFHFAVTAATCAVLPFVVPGHSLTILVGFVQVLGAYYFQDLALAFMYFLMLIVLVIRPGGLLGKEE